MSASSSVSSADFDSPGIDDDVLCRRRERDSERRAAQQHQPAVWTHDRHRHERAAGDDLRQRHPATAPAEEAQQRRVDLIDQRRPEKFERVSETDPRQKPDRGERDIVLAQPEPEGRAREQKWQARAEAKRQGQQHFRAANRFDDIAPADLAARGFDIRLRGALETWATPAGGLFARDRGGLCFARKAGRHREQPRGIDRLGHEIIHAGFKGADAVLLASVGG